ncbi:acyltransferase [Nocardia concava]|uniref:acyltransferase n=1 Tax=Nocardia concava TaxID=257281 RepID=UPI0002DEF2D8|nr:acyltransferase [Nocardia concava]
MRAIPAGGLTRELVRPHTHPDLLIPLTITDRFGSHMPVHSLLVFRSGPTVEALRAALAVVLEHHADYAGRLERRGVAEYIVCRGQGVLLEVQDVDVTLDSIEIDLPAYASALCATECSSTSVQEGIEPLTRIRISRLSDGGQVFATCMPHSLTDGGGLALFLTNLARQLTGEPLAPVDLDRPELPNSPEEGLAALRERQSILPRSPSTVGQGGSRDLSGLVVRAGSDSHPRESSTVPVGRVEIDRDSVGQLRRKHGLVMGHVLNAVVLKALARISTASECGNIFYMPVFNVRGRQYPDNYSGNSVIVGLVPVAQDQLLAEPLERIAKRLFVENIKTLNEKSLRASVSLMRYMTAEMFYRGIEHEASVMIDNVSELSLTRIDFGHGSPVAYFMPPPTDIRVPFIYISQTPAHGLLFQIADPHDRFAGFGDEIARLLQHELMSTPGATPGKADTDAC